MAGLTTASDLNKIILALLLCTGLVFIIAFGAPYWTTRENGHGGLWEGCTSGKCYERWNQWVTRWIKVSQTFMVLCLIFWFFGTALMLLYVFHRDYEEDKRLVCLSAILMFLAAICNLLGVLVWAGGEHMSSGEALNWPFAFACATSLTLLISALLITKELRKRKK